MQSTDFGPVGSRHIYTVGELNQGIQAALQNAFPESVWVRGEVQRLPADAATRKHLYFELHESGGSAAASFQIPAALLEWDRNRFGLGKYLDGRDADFQLQNKLEVCLECHVDFYPPFGRLSLRVIGVDKSFTLGQLEARRREVLALLKKEGLLEKNSRIPWPLLPLQIGLITSAGSAAERDFLTGLEASPFAFAIERIDCRMQGEKTERLVTAAIATLIGRRVDVIVIARGGGSRGDLSWFDQKGIALAIANAPLPVVTAIGHEIDRSIADVVANRSCKTPTAAAELLISRVEEAAQRIEEAEHALLQLSEGILAEAGERLQLACELAVPARQLLQAVSLRLHDCAVRLERQVNLRVLRNREAMTGRHSRLVAMASQRLAFATADHDHRCRRLAKEAPAVINAAARALEERAEKLRLLDPQRLLARGYTLTYAADGRLIKSAAGVDVGDPITTRFQDGHIDSRVSRAAGAPGGRRGSQSGKKGEKSGGKKAHEQQESLFR